MSNDPNSGANSNNAPQNRLANLPNIAPSHKGKDKRSGTQLLGMGLDNQDGHKRITQGDQFKLMGGSQRTHEAMTETVIKTVEDLSRKGRTLHSADPREVAELIHKNAPKQD